MKRNRRLLVAIEIILTLVLLTGLVFSASAENASAGSSSTENPSPQNSYLMAMTFDIVNENAVPRAVSGDAIPNEASSSISASDESVSTLKLPASLEIIDEEAFSKTLSLNKVIVSPGTREIRSQAFANSSVTEVIIPQTVAYIADDAFSGSLFVKIIAEPGSYAYIWANNHNLLADTFIHGDYEYTITNGMCVIAKYNGSDANITIPSRINDMPVIRLADSSFIGNTSIRNVTIPSSVFRVDDLAFKDCTNLESVTMSDTISYIGVGAFMNCANLSDVTLPSNLTRLEYNTFYGCTSLRQIHLPNLLTYIDEGVFYGCTNLATINIPQNLSYLGIGAFYHCSSLQSISLPESVTEINNQLFNGCTSLSQVEISSRVSSIGVGAFYGCSSLQAISLPDRLSSIGYAAFYNCGSLSALTIPGQVTTIGDGAFYGCKSITSLVIPDSVINMGKSLFYQCQGLESIQLPCNLATISEYMFTGCLALRSIDIPETVAEIGYAAFNGCHSLSSVHIPQHVTRINDYAFYLCNSLASIDIDDGVISVGANAFRKCPALTSVSMPASIISISETAFLNTENVTIYGISNTYPETYANQMGIHFVAVGLSQLRANEYTFIVGEESFALFTVNGTRSGSIYLYSSENDMSCGQMHDDGMNGDETANDGIYSLYLDVTADHAKAVQYYANCGSLTTDTVELMFFARPSSNSEEAEQEILEIREGINGIVNMYENNIETQLNEVEEYAEALLEEGLILNFERTEEAVFIQNEYGLTVSFVPLDENSDSNNDRSMGIITFQPCLSTYSSTVPYMKSPNSQDMSVYQAYPDEAARKIDQTFSNYSTNGNNDNSSVTLSKIRGIGANSIVLWHGHGAYYNSSVGSILLTGEDFDLSAWLLDPAYWWDCVQNRIIHDWTGKVRISAGYIEAHCGSMSNSLIYLAACQSGYDSKLANAFLNKGAKAVVANSDTIYTVYNLSMLKSTMEYMCLINNSTANYYTLEEALSAAFSDNGANDVVWAQTNTTLNTSGHAPARPLIFGGDSAKAYRLGDAYGKLSGKVIRADDRQTAIADAAITLYSNDVPYRSETTNSSGSYLLSNLPPRQYKLRIEAPGYIPFTCYAEINVNETTYTETFLMIEGQEGQRGTASGKITNALTGVGIEGVNLEVRAGWNNTESQEQVAWVVTDSSGQYTFELPIGNYTVSATKDGFIPSSFNIVVQPDRNTGNQNHAMSPTISNEQYRIKLTWGENPRDLDSHMQGKYSNGSSFHVYYSSKNAIEGNTTVCNLDVDDTTSYGPEVVTLLPVSAEPYYYYIHRYAGSGTIATSNAHIEVYSGDQLIRTFNVPTDLGSEDYWNVFAIKNGTIIVNNTSTSSGPNLTYAN